MNESQITMRKIIAVWLLSAFVLNIEFNAYFLDDMVLPTPITKIDSIDDLLDSDLRIVVRYDSAFYAHQSAIRSPIIDRIDTYKDFKIIQKKPNQETNK